MASTYMPTSNWTDRSLKGPGVEARSRRPLERVSFKPDAPVQDAAADLTIPREHSDAPDGLMEQIQTSLEGPAAVPTSDAFMEVPMDERPDVTAQNAVMDLPMDAVSARPMDDDVMDTPILASTTSYIEDGLDDAGLSVASSARAAFDRREAPASEPTMRTSAGPRAVGGRKGLLMAAPVGIAAVAAIGFLAMTTLGQGAETPAATPTELPVAMPLSADAPLVGMPVTAAAAVQAAEPPERAAPEATMAFRSSRRAVTARQADQAGQARAVTSVEAQATATASDPVVIEATPTSSATVSPISDPVVSQPPSATPLIEPEPLVIQ